MSFLPHASTKRRHLRKNIYKSENFAQIKAFRNFAFPKNNKKLKVFGNLYDNKKRGIFIATA